MLYAEDMSINGIVLSRECPAEDGSTIRLDHQLNKSMGPVLLKDGDCLYFSNSTFVQYSELNPRDEFTMPFIMDCEIKVGWCFYTIQCEVLTMGTALSERLYNLSSSH